jgi:tetratricopeptide (TPR) repeat protein
LLALALLGGPGSTARADIIFSNFGPNGSYDHSSGWGFGASPFGTVQDIAVFFRVGSRPVTLDEIDVAMSFMSTPNIINLEVLPNVKGAPGPDSQALESFQLVNKLPYFLSDRPPLMIDSVLHPLLDANTGYWLAATASRPTQAIWYDNISPYGGGTFAYRDNNGPWAALGVDPIPAFAILGSPVPEPATLGLLAIGAIALLGRRMFELRRKRSIRKLAAFGLVFALALPGCGKRPAEPLAESKVVAEQKAEPSDGKAEPLAPDYLAEAKVYMQSGENDKALDLFTKAIEAAPKDAQRYVYRGSLYSKKGDVAKAIVDFKKAIELNPKDPEPFGQRGLIFGQMGLYLQAVADLTECLQLSPEGPTAVDAHINRGYAYVQLKQLDKALADYNEALRINPRSAIALEYRAGIYFQQSKLKEALAEFNEAVAIQPAIAELRLNRGLVFRKMGQIDRAIEDFNEAIKLNPNYVAAYIDRGRAFQEKKLTAQAEDDFKKAKELQQTQRQRR